MEFSLQFQCLDMQFRQDMKIVLNKMSKNCTNLFVLMMQVRLSFFYLLLSLLIIYLVVKEIVSNCSLFFFSNFKQVFLVD